MDAASGNRWGHRDATAILLAYRHGLRPAGYATGACGSSATIRRPRCGKAPASCTEAGGSGAFPLTGDERPGAELGATYIRADPSPPQQRGSGRTVPPDLLYFAP